MELNIGSNIIRNTSGVLRVENREQITLEIGERDHQLLLTMDIYDASGTHIARLRRNAWVFNRKNRYAITTPPASLRVVDTHQGGALVVEANVVGKDRIEVLHGRFFTHLGDLLEITPAFWSIDELVMSGNHFDGGGGAVAIG
jgi:hypothetical protein